MSVQADLEFYQAFMTFFGIVGLVTSIGWRRAVVRARKSPLADNLPSADLVGVHQRLDELALELERIGEGQRFLVRTLAAGAHTQSAGREGAGASMSST